MLQKDSSAPSIMGKFLGGWESVDLEPFCLLYPLALGDVHVRGEGRVFEGQTPCLVVADRAVLHKVSRKYNHPPCRLCVCLVQYALPYFFQRLPWRFFMKKLIPQVVRKKILELTKEGMTPHSIWDYLQSFETTKYIKKENIRKIINRAKLSHHKGKNAETEFR